MHIIYKTIGAFNYFAKEIREKWQVKSKIEWEGLTDNATKYTSFAEAELTIRANALDAKTEKINP